MENVSAPTSCPCPSANMAAGPGGHPLRPEGHVHLPGHGLRRRHQRRGRCLPPHPGRLRRRHGLRRRRELPSARWASAALPAMKALSTATDPDRGLPCPLTHERGGFVMGEGSRHAGAGRAGARQSPGRTHLRRGGGLRRQLRRLPHHRPGSRRRRRCHDCMKPGPGRRRHRPGAGGLHQRPRHLHPYERRLRDRCHPRGVRGARQGADRRELHQSP